MQRPAITLDTVAAAFFGHAVGDALGVPVEFKSRETLRKNPVTGMTGYGTHNQPPGTWSDDSSLTFCLAESLCSGYDLQDIAQKFRDWFFKGYWTPHGYTFDVGEGTRKAILNLSNGSTPANSGTRLETENGNGALMRSLPLVFTLRDAPVAERCRIIHEVSSITHAHIVSRACCHIFVAMGIQLLAGMKMREAYEASISECADDTPLPDLRQLQPLNRLLSKEVPGLEEHAIASGGYVVHTLEASIWCLLQTSSYRDAVLTAVNLGGDTDTVAAITGGLAGLYYGLEAIPGSWIDALAGKERIRELAAKFHASLQ